MAGIKREAVNWYEVTAETVEDCKEEEKKEALYGPHEPHRTTSLYLRHSVRPKKTA